MNNDRLLTRVFDIQEKKMIYPVNYANEEDRYSDKSSSIVSLEIANLPLVGITDSGLICDFGYDGIIFEKFGDRYVPMQCMGGCDKNKKLIYQKDIAKAFDEKEQKSVVIEIDYYDFEYQWVGVYQDDYNSLIVFKDFELLGNRYEHPELKDKITKYQDIYKSKLME